MPDFIVNRKLKKIELYILYWICYLLLFTILQGLTEGDFLTVFRNEFFSLIPKVVFVAIVVEALMADLLFHQKIVRFIVVYVLLMAVFALALRLIDNYIILKYFLTSWTKEPILSVAPFLYNCVKLQFVLTIPFCIKLYQLLNLEKVRALQIEAEKNIDEKNLLMASKDGDTFLSVKCERRMVKMNFNDICYAEAQGNYLVIFTMNGTYKTYLSISDLQSKLPEVLFARVHRSFIVALNKIESHNNSEITIGDKKIPIGRSYISKVREVLP